MSLPPIARVASPDADSSTTLAAYGAWPPPSNQPKQSRQSSQPQRATHTEQSSFIGGLALENYRREQQQQQHDEKRPRQTHSGAARELQNAGAGKRPSGGRLPVESHAPPVQSLPQEPARDKRGLPFLKNPLSTLLLRRKSSQNILPELSLPLRAGREELSYQPIRGTRVHDFSAPRPKRVVSTADLAPSAEKPAAEKRPPAPPVQAAEAAEQPPTPAPPIPPKSHRRSSSLGRSRPASADVSSISSGIPSFSSKAGQDVARRKSSVPSSISTLSRNTSAISRNTSAVSSRDVISSIPKHMKSTSSRFSFDMIGAASSAEKLLEEKHRQRQQNKDGEPTDDRRDSRFDDFDDDGFDYDAMDYDDDGFEEAIPGVNVEYVDDDYEADMDPDNDQENFAGFVFQRSNPGSALESPTSAGLLPTPRDAEGNVIGYAMTKESPDPGVRASASIETIGKTPQPAPSISTASVSTNASRSSVSTGESPTGLGIQGLDAAIDAAIESHEEEKRLSLIHTPQHLDKDDELYFGGHDFEGEGDGNPIDESLFDLDDTDQYGRPIPGLFASALAQRMGGEDSKKREPEDLSSKLSGLRSKFSVQTGTQQTTAPTGMQQPTAQTGMQQPTAQTSLAVDLHKKLAALEAQEEQKSSSAEEMLPLPDLGAAGSDSTAAYQAALAAAAYKAAASGKFRRDESPLLPAAELTITSPTTVSSRDSNQNTDDTLAEYEYEDDFSNGLDDYELDDDAIIAEANASALANDDDGWYGQEFGFYSAPMQQSARGGNPNMPGDAVYGGYFGPSGVTRSKSGHMVSREPNLTPITERSEYSNRNSIMSLQMPTSARDGPLQSPGIAQLAMMADDDNISLSALLRLRNKAWGGSQVSLASSREGSPGDRNGASSPMGQDYRDSLGVNTGHGRKNSAFSIWSQDSGAASGSGSPTLTMPPMLGLPNNAVQPPLSAGSNPNPLTSPLGAPLYSPPPPPPPLAPLYSPPPLPSLAPSAFPPVIEDEEADTDAALSTEPSSPAVGPSSQRPAGLGHRHRGSADSISYTKEEDSGETRWVLERRRTAESGEIEILGREVVEGGRI